MQAATIKLFLPTGDATGIRTAEISNWTGKAIAGPRTEIDKLVQRSELDRPGVYLLLGHDDSGDPLIYIGEAECVKNRLKQHKVKEFWVQVMAFTSKDENLTKGHIKYLEAELIKQVKVVGKATLENSQSGNAVLPESDIADMEVFLSRMYQLLPVLGTDVFIATTTKKPKASNLLYCKKGNAVAQGQRSPNGFLIFKDSTCVSKETTSIPLSIKKARTRLMEKGIMVGNGDVYSFTKDYECTSPSLAAAIVRGGSANGMTEWKTKSGKTLKLIESE
jgi:hypothetical protein